MKPLNVCSFALWMLLGTASIDLVLAENTNSMLKPPVALPGGLSLHPVVTSVTQTQGLATVRWFGIQGPFQVLHSTAPQSNVWRNLGAPTFASSLTTPLADDRGFFRVLSGRPAGTSEASGTLNYVGATACIDCHAETVQEWAQTPHAHALESLKAVGQQNNSACLVCHTVGFDTPLGFQSETATPHLTGVQCENCHGPAANHIAVTRDVSVRPKVTVAAEVCGGCHNYHHPTFDEWRSSAHSMTNADVSTAILQQGEPRMMTCGPCHSGAVREALLESVEHPKTELPSRIDAAYFPVTCAACHDPHANMEHPPRQPNPQLRNPVYSTANYSYTPSTNRNSFAAQYNPDIHVCGQCHNMRGARWQDTSRPPHLSPQYNLLVGQGAYDLGNSIIAPHGSDIPTQCIQCHSAPLSASTGSGSPAPNQTATNYYPHTFGVTYEACVKCHNSAIFAQRAVTNTQAMIKGQIADVKGLLDAWATNKAPADLRTKYGTLAWEYNVPGILSNPVDTSGLQGPSATEQAQVPDAIKQARFNLYLVNGDGSFGVHNGPYARYLLSLAKDNVNMELSKP